MIQIQFIVRYTVITEIPRVMHTVTFTSRMEAVQFIRQHQHWFAFTELSHDVEVRGRVTIADMV